MTLVAENRFLQSFCAVAASSVLVCGSLLLLTSTAPWIRPQIEAEPSTPDAARLSTRAKASIDNEISPAASDQAEPSPAIEGADRILTASTDKDPDQARSPEPDISSADQETLAALGTPLDPETADAGEDVGAEAVPNGEQQAGRASLETPLPVTANTAPEPAGPSAGKRSEVATAQLAQVMTTLPPRVITSDRSEAATDQIADVLAALPPAPPAPAASDKTEAASIKVAAVMSDMPPTPSASDKIETASLKVAALTAASPLAPPVVEVAAVAAPPPPLPRRKPEAPPAPKVAAVPTPEREKPAAPEAPKQAVAQQDTTPAPASAGPWTPMALAPADKPSVSLSKAPINKPSGAAYAGKVWSRLARHKPRAGQRGSASVSFAIGENGALRAVRVARSSGNSRIDQLALATVRNAAPFPPPPSGTVSYTIRIDFQ